MALYTLLLHTYITEDTRSFYIWLFICARVSSVRQAAVLYIPAAKHSGTELLIFPGASHEI